MRTPNAGTARQVLQNPIRAESSPPWWNDHRPSDCPSPYCCFSSTIMLAAFVMPYNVLSCFIGRYILDHYHLWHRTLPLGVERSGGKDGELIAAAIAGAFSASFIITLYNIASWSVRYGYRHPGVSTACMCLPTGPIKWCFWAILILWSPLPLFGALMHLRFDYVDPVSMLGIYGFGAMIIFPGAVVLIIFLFYLVDKLEDADSVDTEARCCYNLLRS
ncbi:hypothetical protein DL96DRAFT_1625425 [Flagelloscypha sp. PMI_526]|nr:hypothetical protein DL96DRAFT_1625425 [Flagelloscypha sp. PMI_526]